MRRDDERQGLRGGLVLALALIAGACGGSPVATAPSSTEPGTALSVTSFAPVLVEVRQEAIITVEGTGFGTGLSVSVYRNAPPAQVDGGWVEVDRSKISNVRPASFTFRHTFQAESIYWLQVAMPGGKRVDGPRFLESADTRPVIQSMNPDRPVEPGPNNRSLTLYGRWFRDGLTVLFTDPRGPRAVEGRVVQGNTIFLFTPLPAAGRYAVQVTNPDGRSSNEFVFTVEP
jgi:hypothetical protein